MNRRHPAVLLPLLVVALPWSAAGKSIVLPAETARLQSSDAPGYALASGLCVVCHSADYVQTQPPMPRKFWDAEVLKMNKVYGAPIPPEQMGPIAEYLAKVYGAKIAPGAGPSALGATRSTP